MARKSHDGRIVGYSIQPSLEADPGPLYVAHLNGSCSAPCGVSGLSPRHREQVFRSHSAGCGRAVRVYEPVH